MALGFHTGYMASNLFVESDLLGGGLQRPISHSLSACDSNVRYYLAMALSERNKMRRVQSGAPSSGRPANLIFFRRETISRPSERLTLEESLIWQGVMGLSSTPYPLVAY